MAPVGWGWTEPLAVPPLGELPAPAGSAAGPPWAAPGSFRWTTRSSWSSHLCRSHAARNATGQAWPAAAWSSPGCRVALEAPAAPGAGGCPGDRAGLERPWRREPRGLPSPRAGPEPRRFSARAAGHPHVAAVRSAGGRARAAHRWSAGARPTSCSGSAGVPVGRRSRCSRCPNSAPRRGCRRSTSRLERCHCHRWSVAPARPGTSRPRSGDLRGGDAGTGWRMPIAPAGHSNRGRRDHRATLETMRRSTGPKSANPGLVRRRSDGSLANLT